MRFLTPIRRFPQPTKEEVDRWVGIQPDMAWKDKKPTMEPEEWGKDHRDYILRYWLPMLRPNKKIWRITVEAYLSGAELRSNGSTAVPDLDLAGRIKDPMGVAHDYLFELHHLDLPDAYGHEWGLLEANRMYRDFLFECGCFAHGAVRWIGLFAVSWIPWNFGMERGVLRLAPV